jgi:hypothetical protein
MTIAVMRSHGNPLTVRLEGPPGKPSVLPPATKDRPPSHYAATLLHQQVADTVKRMQDTAGLLHTATDYGVTDVPETFWNAWLEQNSNFDVIRYKMVFPL